MKDLTLPPLPEIPKSEIIPYSAIRYVAGYTESFVHKYAQDYARAALSHHEDGGRAATRGVVVPMEATEAMLAAVRKRPHPTRPDGWDAHHATLWRAMVAAHQATGGAP